MTARRIPLNLSLIRWDICYLQEARGYEEPSVSVNCRSLIFASLYPNLFTAYQGSQGVLKILNQVAGQSVFNFTFSTCWIHFLKKWKCIYIRYVYIFKWNGQKKQAVPNLKIRAYCRHFYMYLFYYFCVPNLLRAAFTLSVWAIADKKKYLSNVPWSTVYHKRFIKIGVSQPLQWSEWLKLYQNENHYIRAFDYGSNSCALTPTLLIPSVLFSLQRNNNPVVITYVPVLKNIWRRNAKCVMTIYSLLQQVMWQLAQLCMRAENWCPNLFATSKYQKSLNIIFFLAFCLLQYWKKKLRLYIIYQ